MLRDLLHAFVCVLEGSVADVTALAELDSRIGAQVEIHAHVERSGVQVKNP